MSKNFKKLLSIALACVMMVMCMGGYGGEVAYAMTLREAEINFDELIAVVIYETEDEVLTAYVDSSDVAEYTYRLENEIGYRESQVAMAQNNHVFHGGAFARCFPPSGGLLESRETLDESDIENYILGQQISAQEYLNAVSTSQMTFVNLLLSFVPGAGAIYAVVSAMSYIAANEAKNATQSWWHTALYEIAKGEISSVCRCIYQNIKTEYPKAWVLLSKTR